METNPAARSTLVSRVLASDFATREAILEALIQQQKFMTIQDTGVADYMEVLRASSDTKSAFVNCLQIISHLSGSSFKMSAGICVGNLSRGFGFPLVENLTGEEIFDVALRGNLHHAASFLTRIRAVSMIPTSNKGELPTDDVDEDDDTPVRKRPRNGFICYGKVVQWDVLQDAYQHRIANEPESTRGFWGRLADDIGIPNHATATGRSGVVHKRYCDHFNHPFV
jgi:hypothetical protein